MMYSPLKYLYSHSLEQWSNWYITRHLNEVIIRIRSNSHITQRFTKVIIGLRSNYYVTQRICKVTIGTRSNHWLDCSTFEESHNENTAQLLQITER